MSLNKYNHTSDAIADLYRASLYIARGSKEVGLAFLLKAKIGLGNKIVLDVTKITNDDPFKSKSDYLFWAEKILDEYKRLK